jgi:hypothetical protein
MSSPELLLFIVIAGLGSFVQALSGFALGLIVLGSVTLLQLAPIPFTAAVISMISLANGGWVLTGIRAPFNGRAPAGRCSGWYPPWAWVWPCWRIWTTNCRTFCAHCWAW